MQKPDYKKKKVDHYLLELPHIGSGQFGSVYKAIDSRTDKVYAVKCIAKSLLAKHSKYQELFRQEQSIMAKLDHPNIVHLYDSLETQSNHYLVITFCEGGSLEDLIKKKQFIKEKEAVYFLQQILNGFEVLRKNNIMHRDLKPDNIFIKEDKMVIGDFGMAKEVLNKAITKVGSPLYLAPEILRSDSSGYTSAVDMWSIGVTFYQMLYGTTPWMSPEITNNEKLHRAILQANGQQLKFPKSPEISELSKEFLRKALEYNPEQRLSWTNAFNHELFKKSQDQTEITTFEDEIESRLDRTIVFYVNQDAVKKDFEQNAITAEQPGTIDKPNEPANPSTSSNLPKRPESKDQNASLFKQVESKKVVPDSYQQKEAEKLRLDKIDATLTKFIERFTHQKLVIESIVDASKSLIVITDAYKSQLEKGAAGFFSLSYVLMKKVLILMNTLLKALNDKPEKMFGIADFPVFANSLKGANIKKSLESDNKINLCYLNKIKTKIGNLIPAHLDLISETINIVEAPDVTIEDLQKESRFLVNCSILSLESNESKYSPELKAKIKSVIVKSYKATEEQQFFPFETQEGEQFRWCDYKKSITNPENEKFISMAVEQYKNMVDDF